MLDDLSTGRTSNLAAVWGDPAFRFQEGAVLDEELVDRLAAECDVVVQLAAVVGVDLVEERGLATVVVRMFNTVSPRQRGEHGSPRRQQRRVPARQLAPGADLHGRRRLPLRRVRPGRDDPPDPLPGAPVAAASGTLGVVVGNGLVAPGLALAIPTALAAGAMAALLLVPFDDEERASPY